MKFFDKIQFLFSSNFDSFIRKYLEGEEGGGTAVIGQSSSKELKYSALFACFRVIAETLASVPIREYQMLSNGSHMLTDETSIYDLFQDRVNKIMSPYNFFEAMVYQLLLGGNAVAQVARDKAGNPLGLFPMNYTDFNIEFDNETFDIRYKIGQDKILHSGNVLHIAGPSTNGYTGMSILEYARSAIGLGQSYEMFGRKFYDNGAVPSGVFETEEHLGDTAFDKLKAQIDKNSAGLHNAGRPMLLESGLKFKQLTFKPIDAQLIENRRFQVEDVCRFCRVPPHMIQDLSRSTNNNIEHQSLEFIRFTMLPYFRRFEEAINNQLLSEQERLDKYYYEFDLSSLLRGDSITLSQVCASGRQWGYLSANDSRKMWGLNEVDNGDIYLQPVNMVEAGTVPEQTEEGNDNKEEIEEGDEGSTDNVVGDQDVDNCTKDISKLMGNTDELDCYLRHNKNRSRYYGST